MSRINQLLNDNNVKKKNNNNNSKQSMTIPIVELRLLRVRRRFAAHRRRPRHVAPHRACRLFQHIFRFIAIIYSVLMIFFLPASDAINIEENLIRRDEYPFGA
jgi:hypothetical protein